MFTKQQYRLDKTQPALVVRQGNTPNKHFYLTERSSILGSGRGCDIQLAAEGVSAVHCVITRGVAGYHVRDCASRLGTKVNGVRVDGEAPLGDGDLLQLGMFLFEVSLPPTPSVEDTPVDRTDVFEKKIDDLKKSRERLVLLAAHLRRRLLARLGIDKRPAGPGVNPDRPLTMADLSLDELEALAVAPQDA